MLRPLAIALAVGTLTATAAATAHAAHTIVGMGEQSPEMFQDPRFHATGIRNARLLVPWDLIKEGGVAAAPRRTCGSSGRTATGSSRSSPSGTRWTRSGS